MDLKQLALAASPWFKFPRVSLEFDADGEYFVDYAAQEERRAKLFALQDSIFDE
jgi:hypothetical protein